MEVNQLAYLCSIPFSDDKTNAFMAKYSWVTHVAPGVVLKLEVGSREPAMRNLDDNVCKKLWRHHRKEFFEPHGFS